MGGPHHCLVTEPDEPDPDVVVARSEEPQAAVAGGGPSSMADDLHFLIGILLGEVVSEVTGAGGADFGITLSADGGVQLRGEGLSAGGACALEVAAAQGLWSRFDVGAADAVRFWPDPAIFGTAAIDGDVVTRRAQELAFFNPSLTANVTDESSAKTRTFHYPGGLVDFVKFINRIRTPIHPIAAHFHAAAAKSTVEVALQWNAGYAESLYVYVNGASADGSGPHAEDVRTALATVASRYAKKRRLLRVTEPDLLVEDICEGLAAVVSVQTTDRQPVEDIVVEHLTDWFEANPTEARIILDKAISSSDARTMPRSSRCGMA
jgi:hypothetical protein